MDVLLGSKAGHDGPREAMPGTRNETNWSCSRPAAPAAICFRPRRWRSCSSKRGLTVDLATDHRAAHFKFPARAVHLIPSATLRGRNPIALARTGALLALGTAKAWLLIGQIRPAVVVGFGGYPTVPPLWAASLRAVPTILHEQNGVMGRANRLLAPRVSAIATSFPKLTRLDARLQAKITFTGNPVRPQVIAAAATPLPRRRRAENCACWCSAAARARM